MAKNRQYPVMLGMSPADKQVIGIKSCLGSGYDLYILDEDLKYQYVRLHFCTKESIDSLVELLQAMKKLWEEEEHDDSKQRND